MRRGDDLARGRQDARRLIASTIDLDGPSNGRPLLRSPARERAAPVSRRPTETRTTGLGKPAWLHP